MRRHAVGLPVLLALIAPADCAGMSEPLTVDPVGPPGNHRTEPSGDGRLPWAATRLDGDAHALEPTRRDETSIRALELGTS